VLINGISWQYYNPRASLHKKHTHTLSKSIQKSNKIQKGIQQITNKTVNSVKFINIFFFHYNETKLHRYLLLLLLLLKHLTIKKKKKKEENCSHAVREN